MTNNQANGRVGQNETISSAWASPPRRWHGNINIINKKEWRARACTTLFRFSFTLQFWTCFMYMQSDCTGLSMDKWSGHGAATYWKGEKDRVEDEDGRSSRIVTIKQTQWNHLSSTYQSHFAIWTRTYTRVQKAQIKRESLSLSLSLSLLGE